MAKLEKTNFTVSVSDSIKPAGNGRSEVEVTFEVLDNGTKFYKNVSTYYDFPDDYRTAAVEEAKKLYGSWPVKLTGVHQRDLHRLERAAAKLIGDLVGLSEQGHAPGTPVTGPNVFR